LELLKGRSTFVGQTKLLESFPVFLEGSPVIPRVDREKSQKSWRK